MGDARYNRVEFAKEPMWRVKHDPERPDYDPPRVNLPEVYRVLPFHEMIFTAEMQWLWYRVSGISDPMQWRKLGGNELYLFNGYHGWPGHADHVNGLELDRPNPRAPQMLICGGALVTGNPVGGRLYLNGIDIRQPLPHPSTVVSKRLRYVNTTMQSNGTIGRFPQGEGKNCFTPLFLGLDAYLPLSSLVYIPPGSPLPSPFELP